MPALSIEEELYRDATLTITSTQVIYQTGDGGGPRVIPIRRIGPCSVAPQPGWILWSAGLLCVLGVISFALSGPVLGPAGVALITFSAGVGFLVRTKAVTKVSIAGPGSGLTVTFSGQRQAENADQVLKAIAQAQSATRQPRHHSV